MIPMESPTPPSQATCHNPRMATSEVPEFNAQTQRLRQMISAGLPVETRRDTVYGQLMCCQGCCCGRTDRGFPALPVEWIKERWKSRKLNNAVQLTISGCLGPCDVANVVCVVTSTGEMIWLGGLTEHWQYEQLVEWAERSQDQGYLATLPSELSRHIFQRFQTDCCEGGTSTSVTGVTTC